MHPGSVVWVELAPTRGREQSGRRPAVVVSSEDHLDAVTALVTVVPATTRQRGWPNHVALIGPHGLTSATSAMTEQVRTVDRTRITDVAGQVSPECFTEIMSWVRRWLA
jgi:mRNA interferase MazF